MNQKILSCAVFGAFALVAAAAAADDVSDTQRSASDRLLRSSSKPRYYDRETLKRELSESMDMIEALAVQAKSAPKAELDEVWASGERDFKLSSGAVSDTRKACQALLQAMDLEAAHEASKAAALRRDARDTMNSHHKRRSEAYVRDLRNWISVSEGALRRANEAREKKK